MNETTLTTPLPAALPAASSAPRAGRHGKKSNYIPGLDGIRALAFFFVFFAHTTGHSRISRFIPATFGVTIFFFLSGYLITTLLREEADRSGTISLKDFYIRRSVRIFIPMCAAYLAATLIGLAAHESLGTLRGLLSTVFYCFNYLRMFHPLPYTVGGFDVVWSLCVEEHFYLLFPLLFIFMMSRRIPPARRALLLLGLCLAALAWRTYVWTHNFPNGWTYYATDCRFDSILWGSILAFWGNPRFPESTPLLTRFKGPLAAAALVVLIATMSLHSLTFRETLRYTVQGIALLFIFRFVISTIQHPTVRWLENRVLRYIGWVSYALYLIHRAIQYAVEPYLGQRDWLIMIVCFSLSMLYAVFIRYTLELPLQRLRARFRPAR